MVQIKWAKLNVSSDRYFLCSFVSEAQNFDGLDQSTSTYLCWVTDFMLKLCDGKDGLSNVL